jgi:hypothetical protein
MKFSLLAIVATAAGAVTSTNAKAFSISSSITPSSRKMYYDDYFTKREDITGDNVFVFEACYEVTTAQADNLDDTIIQAIKDGNARTGASYATFFTTPSMSVENRMVTSIGDYVAGKVKAAALAERWKCNECTQYQEYCEDMLNRNSPDWYEQVNNGGGGNQRNLSFRGPDCYSCAKCYSDNYQDDASKTTVANFADDIANCYNTGYQDENGYSYYVGFACGSSGDTAEIATFLDADCFVQSTFSAYTALTANGSTYGDYSTKQTIEYLKPYLADAMTTTTECRSPVYDDPEMWDQEVGDDMYAYSDNEAYVDPDYSQASQECHLIAGRAVYVNECEVNNDDQALEEAYAEQYDTSWYEVDVQNPEDEVEVCAVINAKLSNNNHADWDYFYNEKESGSMYDRDWLGRVIASSSNKMSGASIFLIVVLVIGAVIVAPVVWRMKKKRDKANARNGGLVEPIGGALA